jgi:ribosomal-protein-alanine N-acetyltransferase
MSAVPSLAVRYHRLREDDIPGILAIEQEAYPDPWSEGMFRHELYTPFSHFYVGSLSNAEMVGYGGFWLVQDEAHITKITIARAYRGMGLGKDLIHHLLRRMRDLGADLVRLEVRRSNAVARSLYLRVGFKEIGVRKAYYNHGGEDAIVMAAQLNTMPRWDISP